MSLVWNEQTKLSATFMNGVAVAMVAAGAIAPLAAASYHLPSAAPTGTVAAYGAAWFAGGMSVHLSARRLLRTLRP